MELREIRGIARTMGIDAAAMDRPEVIRAIQRAEGKDDCFGSAAAEECDEENCLWRDDCFAEAMGDERTA